MQKEWWEQIQCYFETNWEFPWSISSNFIHQSLQVSASSKHSNSESCQFWNLSAPHSCISPSYSPVPHISYGIFISSWAHELFREIPKMKFCPNSHSLVWVKKKLLFEIWRKRISMFLFIWKQWEKEIYFLHVVFQKVDQHQRKNPFLNQVDEVKSVDNSI